MWEPGLNVASPEFLRWMHQRFYGRLPGRLRWVLGDDGERVYVEAGLFRTRFVKVGRHIPPVHEPLDRFLERFALFYDPAQQHVVRPLIALARRTTD